MQIPGMKCCISHTDLAKNNLVVSFCRLPPNPIAWLALLASHYVARATRAAQAQEKENQNPTRWGGQRGDHWIERGRVLRRRGAGECLYDRYANNICKVNPDSYVLSLCHTPPFTPSRSCLIIALLEIFGVSLRRSAIIRSCAAAPLRTCCWLCPRHPDQNDDPA